MHSGDLDRFSFLKVGAFVLVDPRGLEPLLLGLQPRALPTELQIRNGEAEEGLLVCTTTLTNLVIFLFG